MPTLAESPEPRIDEVIPGTDQLKFESLDEFQREAREWDRAQIVQELRAQTEQIKLSISDAQWRIVGCIIIAATSYFWLGLVIFLSPELLKLFALVLKHFLKRRRAHTPA